MSVMDLLAFGTYLDDEVSSESSYEPDPLNSYSYLSLYGRKFPCLESLLDVKVLMEKLETAQIDELGVGGFNDDFFVTDSVSIGSITSGVS